jgi:negative regulator of genetic competence, sporulation and motility
MKKFVEEIVRKFEENLYYAFNTENETYIKDFIDIHNTYQENNHDCIDYIYDMNNKEDLASCVKGGMTIENIVNLYNTKKTQYFLLPLTETYTTQSMSADMLLSTIFAYREEIVRDMLLFPHQYKNEMYQDIIAEYFRESIT